MDTFQKRITDSRGITIHKTIEEANKEIEENNKKLAKYGIMPPKDRSGLDDPFVSMVKDICKEYGIEYTQEAFDKIIKALHEMGEYNE